jgi:hypothetical protein
MSALITVYWVCFGVGLIYIACSAVLGSLGHGLGGHGGDVHTGDASSLHFEAGAHEAGPAQMAGAAGHDAAMESADLDNDNEVAGVEGHALDMHPAVHEGHGGVSAMDYNPFSLLSLMGFACAFGAAGLIATAAKLSALLGLGAAFGGGVIMALLLWLVIGKLLFSMQGSSEAHQSDLPGLDAEALTPIDDKMAGEIAYILDGVRYTAPARLAYEGSIAKRSTVRIKRIENNVIYVEEKKKLLA